MLQFVVIVFVMYSCVSNYFLLSTVVDKKEPEIVIIDKVECNQKKEKENVPNNNSNSL